MLLPSPEHSLVFLLHWMDYIGVSVGAISGALEASRRQLDIVGFALIAAVTGMGGGTVRDLLLGVNPVWIANPTFLLLCVSMAVLVFFTAHLFESRYKVLLWVDAVSMAIFCILGAEKAAGLGMAPSICILMGVMTASFGGLVRDIICNETPLILRHEIYATAAVLGASLFMALHALEFSRFWCIIPAFLAAFTLRAAAILYGLSLPGYKSRPGRNV